MDDKIKRHSDIKEIIQTTIVNSQSGLLNNLISRGHSITQATLSRDLKRLKASKIPDENGSYKYILQNGKTDSQALVDYDGYTMRGFISIEFSGYLGIIRTHPAFGNTIASAIDSAEIKEVMGTVAGDDTVLIIAREGFTKFDVVRALKMKFPVLKDILK